VDIPADLQPGGYRLVAGLFEVMGQRRVPLTTGQDVADVTRLKLALPPPAAAPDRAVDAVFGGRLRLIGITTTPLPGALQVGLHWQALQPADFDYTVFVHLLNDDSSLAGQADAEPLNGQYPMTLWEAGEIVVDGKVVTAPPGTYRLSIGVYRWDTGERLPMITADGAPGDDRVDLGTVTVP
jgi:hypothetical protein